MRVREAGTGGPTLVDHRVHVREALAGRGLEPPPPRLGRQLELAIFERGERAHVTWRVDDDLLALERGVEIRDDAHGPAAVLGQDERLRRRPVLAARAERARVPL